MERLSEMTSKVTTLVLAAGMEDPGRVVDDATQRPDPEVPERARRRTFTVKYKLEVLAAYDAAPDGEKGAVLRGEGLYSSHITEWRKARDAGGLAGLGRPGKTARALGDALRRRGYRSQVDTVTDQAVMELTPQLGVRAGCQAVGAAQARLLPTPPAKPGP
jgi:hypothetical protein